jgi:hypothetical protein
MEVIEHGEELSPASSAPPERAPPQKKARSRCRRRGGGANDGTGRTLRRAGLGGGERQPENPSEVARAIVAVANEAGLALSTDEHLRAEEICGELPYSATAVQCSIVIAVEVLSERLLT